MPIDYRGRTALITGASSGIGAEFARQLAARGSDLVLVARRTERLETLAAELRATHGITATVIPADLAKARSGATLVAETAKRGLEVHSLVASAGFGTYNDFADEDGARIAEEVAVNVAAVVDVVHAFYPELLRHADGALVTLASTAAYQPIPQMAVYGATKAFVLSFTEALWYEARGNGLKVMALCPGVTTTEFTEVAGDVAAVAAAQTPEQVVRVALKTLDRRNPPPSVISGALSTFLAGTAGLLTPRIRTTMSGRLTAKG
jgi:short-subunit dehydrogenase